MSTKEYFELHNDLFSIIPSTNTWYKFIDITDLDNPNNKRQAVVSFDANWVKNYNSGKSISIFKYISEVENIPIKEVFSMLNINTDDFKKQEVVKVPPANVYTDIKIKGLPEGFINIASGKGSLSQRARSYLKGRGFSITKLSKLNIGYIKKQDSEFFGYIIFPVYEHGELVYYATRNFIGALPKHKNPNKEDIKLGKSEVLFNHDALYKFKDVFLTEGIADALTIGSRCIASLGWSLSRIQFRKIIKAPAESITIIPDRGFYSKQLKIAKKLIEHKKVRVLNFDKIPVEKGKDVNLVGRNIVMKHVDKTKYLTFGKIINQMVNYEI